MTFVSTTKSGFTGDELSITKQAFDASGGFTSVLAGLKAYLEHGVQLNLVAIRAGLGADVSARSDRIQREIFLCAPVGRVCRR
jgi:hypothetical protein